MTHPIRSIHRRAAAFILAVASPRRYAAPASPCLSTRAANKASLNQAYELMGMRTHLHYGWQWHTLSIATRRRAQEFGAIARAEGLKAAIDRRDEAFRREGFIP